MKNLGIYFDSNGYGLTLYSKIDDCFHIEYMEYCEKPSVKSLLKTCLRLDAIDTVYINSSKNAVYSLLGNNLRTIENSLINERVEKTDITFSDCYETLNTLLADDLIVVNSDYESLFTVNFKNYILEEVNHIVFSVFYGIGVMHLKQWQYEGYLINLRNMT